MFLCGSERLLFQVKGGLIHFEVQKVSIYFNMAPERHRQKVRHRAWV